MGKIRGIKKIRRKCMVRNCRNFDSYSVSCTGELGQSIHICEECARDIVRAIDEKYPKVKITEEKAPEMISEAENKPKKTRKKTNESGE